MQDQYTQLLKKAQAWASAHRDEYIDELRGLVRFPSVSRADLAAPGAPFGPDCRAVLDHALDMGRRYGFTAIDHDGYAASLCLGDPGHAIGAIAHLDVVPVGDGWVYPPFEATYLPEHDMLIGRGVGDNKGPAVASLFAMRMLREFGWPLRHGLRLMCGTSEETGMQDMQALRQRGLRFPQVSLVPDAGFPVNYAQKGSVDAELAIPCEGNLLSFDSGTVRNIIPDLAECTVAMDAAQAQAAFSLLDAGLAPHITVTACEGGARIAAAGRAGHAASPASGENAIALLTAALTQSGILVGSCARAIAELAALTADGFGHGTGVACSDEPSGDLTLVYGVAHLRGGQLIVSVDSRTPVTFSAAQLVPKMAANWALRGFSVVRCETSEPFYIPKEDPRVTALMDLYREVTGRDDPPYAMGGGTYSRVVPNAISFGPAVPGDHPPYDSFLPAGHGTAHGRDEAIPVARLLTCSAIYAVAMAMLDELED